MPNSNKVIVVTGGSRGIGAATSLLAANQGFKVCVNYHSDSSNADNIVDEIRKMGGEAIARKADVANAGDVADMFDAVAMELGVVTAVVNNAGIFGRRCRVDKLDPQTLQRVLEVNVSGCFNCAREAVRRMSTAYGGPGGAIVNISSRAAVFGGDLIAHYAASKAAIDALSLGLAREVAAEGIRVNAVSPGIINTTQNDFSKPDRLVKLAGTIPMGRIGEPEEVAKTIIWLLSDEASYVTGTIIPVAGGR